MLDRFSRWLENLLVKLHLGRFAQFVGFGLVGACNTVVHLSIYWLTLNLLGWDKQLCNGAAFAVSVTSAYLLNCRYVFRRQYTPREHAWAYLRTVTSYGATGLVLNGLLLSLWVDVCGVSANIAPLMNMVITIPLNFLLNKFWAFRGEKRAVDAPAGDAPEAEPDPLQSDRETVK